MIASPAPAFAADSADGSGSTELGRGKKGLYLETWGCQMNVYDSQRMQDLLHPLGYAPVTSPEQADLVILNTCHIREKATEKVYSEIGRLAPLKAQRAEQGQSMTLVIAGCVAQAEGQTMLARSKAIDFVIGPQSVQRLPELIARTARAQGQRLATDFAVEEKFDQLPATRQSDGPSAFLSVQEGCDKFCTFCVVPYTRGPEHSRKADDIVAEARVLAAQGVRELVLLGQNVNAWHGEAPAGQGGSWGLGRLLRHLSLIGGVERLRFSTSHPCDMDDDLIAAFGDCPKLQPLMHLPVQSGSDRVLKAMNRRHTAQDFLSIVERLRALRPQIAFATDLIVGFPGETERDFEATMELVRTVTFATAYSFMYSRRPGTPAAEMLGQVPDDVKADRLQRLQKLLFEQQTAFNQSKMGQTLDILFDRPGRRPGQIQGRSPWQQSVYCEGPAELIGQIGRVEIHTATQNALAGNLVDQP